MGLENQLIEDYLKSNGHMVNPDEGVIVSFEEEGTNIIAVETYGDGYYKEKHHISLLTLIAWVYAQNSDIKKRPQ